MKPIKMKLINQYKICKKYIKQMFISIKTSVNKIETGAHK